MKNLTTYFKNLLFVLLLMLANSLTAKILYVDVDAVGAMDGTNWANAFITLQLAIDAAAEGDSIWVAEGIYLPTYYHNNTTERNRTFFINKAVRIYGGFNGEAGTEGDFDARNFVNHPTVLSGNIGDTSKTDNVYHVVYIDHVDLNMVLDGFTIRDAYGFDGSPFDNMGGGIFNDGSGNGASNPTIVNCIIRDNHTSEGGGGVMNFASDGETKPTFINSHFYNNSASGGGGVSNLANPNGDASPTFINCQFRGNSGATAGGGAIQNIAVDSGTCSITLYNCVVSGNFNPTSMAINSFASANGNLFPRFINCTFSANPSGAISTSAINGSVAESVVANCIFWRNGGGQGISDNGAVTNATYSLIPFGFPGEGNIGLDPLFVDYPDSETAPTLAGDFHLTLNSIAIDAGDNSAVPDIITTDLDGLPRIVNSTDQVEPRVDMGAYEFQGNITAVNDNHLKVDWTISPNPGSEQIEIVLPQFKNGLLIRVFDIEGQLHFHRQLNESSTTISMNHLQSGMYVVLLQGEDFTDVKTVVVK